jgi:hypothetical protein
MTLSVSEYLLTVINDQSRVGKYVVSLPFAQENSNSGTSRAGADGSFKTMFAHKTDPSENIKNTYH